VKICTLRSLRPISTNCVTPKQIKQKGGIMSEERFLITGALGCIGAWIGRNLRQQGVQTAVFDLSSDAYRMKLVMSEEELAQVRFITGDITDLSTVEKAVVETGATHVIHLAGLQVPTCKANPTLGAWVNVVGTVNIFEAVRRAGSQVRGLVYASSVAALGPDDFYPQKPIRDDVPLRPDTLYGVYKQANEHTARLYWQDWQISSVGLRPYVVFGVGRDQGLTADLAKAILAAAAKRPFHIKFSGPVALQYVDDTARIFIESARAGYRGAAVCNLRNDVITVADFVTALRAEAPGAQITFETNHPLPFSADLDDSGLRRILGEVPHTPLRAAIRQSLEQFKVLLAQDRIDLAQLEMT
jgi:UDP-glucuronate 4-epimerase